MDRELDHSVHSSDTISTHSSTTTAPKTAELYSSFQLPVEELSTSAVFVFESNAAGANQAGGRGKLYRTQHTPRENVKRDTKGHRETAEDHLREKRRRIRESIQQRRMPDVNFIEDSDDDDNAWNYVPTAEDKALRKARKAADHLYRERRGGRPSSTLKGPQSFSIELEPVLEDETFSDKSRILWVFSFASPQQRLPNSGAG